MDVPLCSTLFSVLFPLFRPKCCSLVEADNKAVRKVQAEQRARREKAAAAEKKAGASSLFGDDDADDSATGAAAVRGGDGGDTQHIVLSSQETDRCL